MIKYATRLRNKDRDRPEKISTDAALASSTLFAVFAQFGALDLPTLRELVFPFAELQRKLGSLNDVDPTSEEARNAWQSTKPVVERIFKSSCEAAADILAKTVTLDRILRKLDESDPRDIVAMLYCVLRLLKDDNSLAELRKDAEDHFGKNWFWRIVWELALSSGTVQRRFFDEEKRGSGFVDAWRDECQKFANNYWAARKKEFERIELLKSRMIHSLRSRLGLG